MNKKNIILLSVLGIQILLAGLFIWQGEQTQEQNKGFALFNGVDVLTANEMEIIAESDAEKSLTLKKVKGQWLLPEEIKANAVQMNEVLAKLSNLRRSWSVAMTVESHQRFEVAEDKYQRQVTLTISGNKYTFFIGTSPGYRNVHVRAKDEESVYSVQLNAFDFSIEKDDWLDPNQLQINDEITAIKMTDYQFMKVDEQWEIEPLNLATSSTVLATRAEELSAELSTLKVINISEMKAIELPTEELRITTDKQSELSYLLFSDGEYYYIQKQGEDVVYGINKRTYNSLLAVSE